MILPAKQFELIIDKSLILFELPPPIRSKGEALQSFFKGSDQGLSLGIAHEVDQSDIARFQALVNKVVFQVHLELATSV